MLPPTMQPHAYTLLVLPSFMCPHITHASPCLPHAHRRKDSGFVDPLNAPNPMAAYFARNSSPVRIAFVFSPASYLFFRSCAPI